MNDLEFNTRLMAMHARETARKQEDQRRLAVFHQFFNSDPGGVWRTISGTPVFIGEGENIKDAIAKRFGDKAAGGSGRSRAAALDTGAKRKGDKWVTHEGKDLPEHAQKLGIPPAWTDVKIASDPKADLLASGKDAKGRDQRIYSEAFTQRQAGKKFSLRRGNIYSWNISLCEPAR